MTATLHEDTSDHLLERLRGHESAGPRRSWTWRVSSKMHSRAVSIVPADIAPELVRIAGVAIVRHRFGWTLDGRVQLYGRAAA